MSYRPDIDGLRAIAVVAVVLNHMAPEFLPGGFVGVDIFFVISGYLITGQLLSANANGELNLAEFYKKRIHRIFPALALISISCLILSGILMSPADWVMVARSVMSAVLGWSNIFFWKEYGNYFSGNASEAPLLHTWSLGIEEQFYLIWPLLVILLLKWPINIARVSLLLVIFLGVIFSEWALGRFSSAAYYLLPTRFFELALGGGLAWVTWERFCKPLDRLKLNVLALLGFLLMSYSLIKINSSSPFPGLNTLLPCLGTAILLFCGSSEHYGKRLLTQPLICHIGKISYSLYLWHWPIIAYANYLFIELSGINFFIALGVSLLLADITWRWVEQPFRQMGSVSTFKKTIFQYFLPSLILILALSLLVVFKNGYPARFNEKVTAYESSIQQRPEKIRAGCHVPSALYRSLPDPLACTLGIDNQPPVGVLWGDSYANHFSGMIDELARHQGLTFMDYTMDACPPLLNFDISGGLQYAERCKQRNLQLIDFIKKSNISWVVLAANWPSDSEGEKSFKETLKLLTDMNLKITLIHSNQYMAKTPGCSVRQVMHGKSLSCNTAEDMPAHYLSFVENNLNKIKVIKPNSIICNAGECDQVINGVLIYRDRGHLNDVGSRELGRQLIASRQGL